MRAHNNRTKKNKVCSIQKFDIQSRMDWLNCVVKQKKTHNPNNSSKKEAPTTNVGTNIRSLDRWRRRRRKLFAMKRVLCVAKVLLDILLDTKNLKHHISRCYKYDSSSMEFERFGIYFENCENIICEHWNRTKKTPKTQPATVVWSVTLSSSRIFKPIVVNILAHVNWGQLIKANNECVIYHQNRFKCNEIDLEANMFLTVHIIWGRCHRM